jgi:hypothetical protein
VLRVAQERKIQFARELEAGKGPYVIRAHAQDDRVGSFELSLCVTKLGRFGDSTGSIGFREEEQNHVFSGKILQRNGLTGVRVERELRSFVTDFQHVSIHPG